MGSIPPAPAFYFYAFAMPLIPSYDSKQKSATKLKGWLWFPAVFVVFFMMALGGIFILEDYIYKSPSAETSPSAPTSSPSPAPAPSETITPSEPSIPATPLRLERMNVTGFGISAGAELTHTSPQELENYIGDMQALGMKWARLDIDWKTVQHEGDQTYDWAPVDRAIASLRRAGIEPIAVLTYAPLWAAPRQDENTHYHYPPSDPVAFAKFAAQVTERYRKDLHYYEVWNEPNYRGFWYPYPNIQDYAVLLQLTSTAIHKVDADKVILLGGLAPVGTDGTDGVGTIKFVKGLYDLGLNQYFDVVALHPYTFPTSPSSVEEWNNWHMVKSVYEIMVARGDGHKKIWLTEFGVPTGGAGTAKELNDLSFKYDFDFMTERAQQIIAAEASSAVVQNRELFGPFLWYNMYDKIEESPVSEHFFGLIRADGSHKPAYATLQEIFKGF